MVIRTKTIVASAAVLLVLSVILISDHRDRQARSESKQEMLEQVREAERKNEEKLAYFKANREHVVSSARQAVQRKDYDSAFAIAFEYFAAGDAELNKIRRTAQKERNRVGAEPTSTSFSKEISRAKFGDDWPFTVEKGEVDCIKGGAVFMSGGKTYRLTGHGSIRRLPAIDPIWKDDPKIPGAKISVGPIIDLALALCK